DAIFCLAGRDYRKSAALEQYRNSSAKFLLLSVGRFEVRSLLALPLPATMDLRPAAAALPPGRRHFFVLLHGATMESWNIALGRLGTMSEIAGLALWLRKHDEVRTVEIISSAIHLRRVRLCCRALLPRGVQVSYRAASPESKSNAGLPA